MDKILIVFRLIPAIIDIIKAIEAAIPAEGEGEKKLAAVRQMLEAVDGSVAKLWPEISSVVGVLVNLFNATGAFGKK